MTLNRLVLLLTLLAACHPCLAADGPDIDDGKLLQFAVDGIRSGLDRSPDSYFAAVIEVAGDKQCVDVESREVCFYEATVIALYAQRGNAVAKGQRVRLLGESTIGSRGLIFAVPAVPDLRVFGGTYAAAKADEVETDRFLEALRTVGLRQDA